MQAHVSGVNWNVYGKITGMTDSAGTVAYAYNTTQERVSKVIGGLTTWYVRDAQGNTLALYDNKSSQFNWREQHLYGSSRLGMWQPNVNLATNNASTVWDTIGKKRYELNNHLQNVMVTITDARTSHTGFFTPNIVASQDYYAFGALMPGRASSSATYRYGFNGKENDNEIKGIGNQQDYGMRIYDPRVGRFLSVDPVAQKFPQLTSYQFASNSTEANIDIDGLESYGTAQQYVPVKDSKAMVDALGNAINDANDWLTEKVKNLLFSFSGAKLIASTYTDIKNRQSDEAQYMMHRGDEYQQIKQNGGDYNNVEKQHQVTKVMNDLKIGKDYEDWFGLSVSGVEVSAYGIISTTFARRTAIDKLAGTFSEFEARTLYKAQEAKIPSLLTKDAPLESQAKEAFNLRNQFRTEARKLMKNRDGAKYLTTEEPNMTWDQTVDKYRRQGLEGDELWNKIIESSQKSRPSADKAAGIK